MQSLMSESSRCADLIKCAYNLGETELKAYKILVEKGPLRSDDLSEESQRNPSSVYRSLQKLMSCGMVYRHTENMEGGGYYHLYIARDKQAVKRDLASCVCEWKNRVDELMSMFEDELHD